MTPSDDPRVALPSPPAPPARLAWTIWAMGALLYLTAFFHRLAPGVMTDELMRDFQISAAGLGNLSAFYFYSYVAMQIPTGLIADTWGPRRLLSCGALVAAAGTLLFALSSSMTWACLGRVLIGGSVAVAFVGILKLSSSWFPQRYYALISGFTIFFGILGAVVAGPPLRLLLNHYHWRGIMLGVAAFTLLVGAAIWRFVRDYPHEKGFADPLSQSPGAAPARGSVLRNIREVLRYRNTRLLLFIPASVSGANLTFAGLWGIPFMTTHCGLSRAQAAMLVTCLMTALALGGPGMGWLSDRIGRRKPLFIASFGITLTCWLVIFFVPNLPWPVLMGALMAIGASSGTQILTYVIGKESVPAHLAGTISGVLNMGVMSGPMLMQPAVGWMLDRHWQGVVHEGVRLYSRSAYQAGFALSLGWIVVGWALLFFLRETYCRQMGEAGALDV